MTFNSLQDLYLHELRDIYNAEMQIIKGLPTMVDSASTPELRRALQDHLDTTRNQATRLETVFRNLGVKPGGEQCEGMQGLLEEAEKVMGQAGQGDVRDAAIIVSAQKVEHYEIAAYGSLETFARMLGREDDAGLLRETLDEEKEADRTLTEIAERIVNKQALS